MRARETVTNMILMVLSLTLLCQCINDVPEECKESPSHGIIIHIRTATPANTRAYTEETGNADENRIDIENGDYRIMLFLGSGGEARYISDVPFHLSVQNGAYTEYYAWAVLTPDFFKDNGIDRESPVDFQLMVLANWEKLAATYPVFHAGETLDEAMSAIPRFAVPDSWMPFAGNNGGIPMFGLYTLTMGNGPMPLPVNPASPTPEEAEGIRDDMYLLRAMAKIEIIDCLAHDPNLREGYPRIGSVEMHGANSDGTLFPDNFHNGEQVEETTIPQDVNTGKTYGFTKTTDRHVLYIPELDYSSMGGGGVNS